jgi:hypothetical protein
MLVLATKEGVNGFTLDPVSEEEEEKNKSFTLKFLFNFSQSVNLF